MDCVSHPESTTISSSEFQKWNNWRQFEHTPWQIQQWPVSQVWRFGELAFCPQKSLAEFTSRVHPLIYTIRKIQFNPIVTCVWRCIPGESKIKNYGNGHQNALKSCKHNNRWCNVHAQFVNTAKKQKKCNSLFQGTLNLWSLVLKRNLPLSISLEA